MADTKTVTVTIATLAQATGPKGKYYVLTAAPAMGRQYGDKYQLTVEQAQGLEAGGMVTLALKRGRLKEGKSGEHEWDYWWDVERITPGAVGSPKLETEKKPNGAQEKAEFPWHRFVAWGDLVEQALKMATASAPLGEEVPPEQQQAEYAKRFEWAMATICAAIRREMGNG